MVEGGFFVKDMTPLLAADRVIVVTRSLPPDQPLRARLREAFPARTVTNFGYGVDVIEYARQPERILVGVGEVGVDRAVAAGDPAAKDDDGDGLVAGERNREGLEHLGPQRLVLDAAPAIRPVEGPIESRGS